MRQLQLPLWEGARRSGSVARDGGVGSIVAGVRENEPQSIVVEVEPMQLIEALHGAIGIVDPKVAYEQALTLAHEEDVSQRGSAIQAWLSQRDSLRYTGTCLSGFIVEASASDKNAISTSVVGAVIEWI